MFRCRKISPPVVRSITTSSSIPHIYQNFFRKLSCRSLSSSNEEPKNEPNPPKKSFFSRFSIENKVKKLIHTTGLTDDEDLSGFIARSVNIGLFSVVGMTLLGTMGFDTKPLIASLGVAGFAAGYALKDAATHFTSGVMLVLQKPFKKGDYIKLLLVVPHEGIVESIDVRYVHLRNKDNNELLIPCSVVYANSILVSPKPPPDWPSLAAPATSTASPSAPLTTPPSDASSTAAVPTTEKK
jgi:small-conductance mechanosensitive channel